MPYTNPRVPRRHGPKIRASRADGYFAVGDLQSGLNTAAGLAQQLSAPGTAIGGTKAGGIVGQYVNPVLSGGAAVLNLVKGGSTSAPAAAPTRMLYASNFVAMPPKASGGTILGLPSVVVIGGAVGVAALLILKKKRR